MKGALPFVGMVVNNVAQVGSTLAAQKAIATGMHTFSFIFYSNALAFLILLPAAFLVHSRSFLAEVIGYAGITYVSATVATAILNLIPGFTFVFALIFGVERLDYGGSAKLIGTLVTVVGALVVTFYKGPTIITYRLSSITPQYLDQSSHWILGGVLMLIDSVIAALFVVAQALTLKKHSSMLIWMLAYRSITAVLAFLASLILEHDLSALVYGLKQGYFVILYSGFFGCGFQITIGAWCMRMKGPLFVVMFQPLGIAIAAIIGVSGGWSPLWMFTWISSNCYWILWCDVGHG
uniref:WAT1-related protein At3g28050-like n=1 Tax=Tanacetum cinerariifolium TaxID=118510 RepID=A0A6L2M6Z3_TANCI|nr:WAT1-related protein At3g28050-like [Tanacetum cinerariifolium]